MNRRWMKCFALLAIVYGMVVAADPKKSLPWLGLSFTWSETSAQTHMLHVRNVARGGPAERAGIRTGDFVAKINGERVDFGDELEFLLFLLERKPGERLRVTLIREGREIPAVVTLAPLAEESRSKWERNLEMARQKRAQRSARSPR
jgi:C-terminal processing protease CtpA/Prc